jgi:hypothetical protein
MGWLPFPLAEPMMSVHPVSTSLSMLVLMVNVRESE